MIQSHPRLRCLKKAPNRQHFSNRVSSVSSTLYRLSSWQAGVSFLAAGFSLLAAGFSLNQRPEAKSKLAVASFLPI
jgi:hypothetical protein